MGEPSPHEHVIRELIEVYGYRPPLPPPGRWFGTSRGRIRAAAWTGFGALLVLIAITPAVAAVSETSSIVVGVIAAAVLLLCLAAIYVDAITAAPRVGEDDENERAVARMVSGKGVRPPD
jgi:hypothetical protein